MRRTTIGMRKGGAAAAVLGVVLGICGWTGGASGSEIQVKWGPTPIPRGECTAKTDLTVITDTFAVAFAVGTTPGWGVPPGTIMDACLVQNSELQRDKLVFFDFLPNGWRAWISTKSVVEVAEQSRDRVVVVVKRDFGQAKVETWYTFVQGSPTVDVESVIVNPTDQALANLESGYSVVSHSGQVHSPACLPALAGTEGEVATPRRPGAWAVSYGEGWSIAVNVPGSTICRGASTYKDLFLTHSVGAKSEARVRASVQIRDSEDLVPLLELASKEDGGVVMGSIAAETLPKESRASLLVEQAGHMYGWTLIRDGHYQVPLPAGQYRIRVLTDQMWTAGPVAVSVKAGEAPVVVDFAKLEPAAELEVRLQDAQGNGRPARVWVDGVTRGGPVVIPAVAFSAKSDPGHVQMRLPAGEYTVYAGYGAPILSKETTTQVTLLPGSVRTLALTALEAVDYAGLGIRCADLHHHADQVDARTPPALVALAQVAAGLDYLFVSDHDTTVNHEAMVEQARLFGLPLIPSVEVSTSWGHFNVYPWPAKMEWPLVDRGRTAQAIFALAHQNGADVQVNHPYAETSPYFASAEAGSVPGGFDPSFQYVELNGHDLVDETDLKALERVQRYWTEGVRYFMSGGSDNHDVRSGKADEVAGCIRTCVYGAADDSVEAFFEALRAGRSFVTSGPTIVANPAPGSRVRSQDLAKGVDVQVWAPLGLKSVRFESAVPLPQPTVQAGAIHVTLKLEALPKEAVWFSIRAEDMAGHLAVTNPVWVLGSTPTAQPSTKQ